MALETSNANRSKPADQRSRGTAPSAASTPTSGGGRVLLIDDSEMALRLVQAWLKTKYDVATASSGVDGIRQAVDSPPDVVILDLDMPQVDGYECCRLLKHDPRTRHAPVIILSGKQEAEQKVRAFDAGAHDFIVKPFNPVELQARVAAAIRLAVSYRSLRDAGDLDPVSGVKNRTWFDRALRARISESARTGRLFTLAVFELPGLAALRANRGRGSSDSAASLAAKAARSVLREEDEFARLDDVTFAALLPDVGTRGAEAAARRVAESVRAVARSDSVDAELSPIFAIASPSLSGSTPTIPDAGATAVTMLDECDQGLRPQRVPAESTRTARSAA